jgi:hypothetical protein
MPVDNHELIALCAPRPVFIGAGNTTPDGQGHPGGDAWADAKGMFMAAAAAGPVYKLLGKKDMGTTVFPPMETALIDGDVAFREHSAGPELAHVPDLCQPVSAHAGGGGKGAVGRLIAADCFPGSKGESWCTRHSASSLPGLKSETWGTRHPVIALEG